MRVMITGGAGFIGSAVCRLGRKSWGWTVLCVDALTYAGNRANVAGLEGSEHFQFAHTDITNAPEIARLFADFEPDAVLHLAAESHVDRSIDGPAAFLNTNIIGTFALLEAARSYWQTLPSARAARFRFLHVSTDEVFGALGDTGSFDEDTRYDPRSPYAASKAASDHLARAWGHTFQLPVIVTNCSNNYGPYQFPEKLIPLVLLNAIHGKPLPVYGDGLQVRDWLYVEDHAEALRRVLEHGQIGETYAIGGRCERTNLDLVHTICAILDDIRPMSAPYASLITHVTDRPGHDRRYAIDCTKIERELGWQPRTSFEDGLRTTIDWYLANESWWRPVRDRVYAGERLGMGQA